MQPHQCHALHGMDDDIMGQTMDIVDLEFQVIQKNCTLDSKEI